MGDLELKLARRFRFLLFGTSSATVSNYVANPTDLPLEPEGAIAV